jgi:hypothetical protein
MSPPSCTLDPGQNTVVFSFNIVPAPTGQPANPMGTGLALPLPRPSPGLLRRSRHLARLVPPCPPTDSIPAGTPTELVMTTAAPLPTTDVRSRDRAAGFWPAGVGWWLAVAGTLAAIASVVGVSWLYTRRRGTRRGIDIGPRAQAYSLCTYLGRTRTPAAGAPSG